jgi:hypothetical protein
MAANKFRVTATSASWKRYGSSTLDQTVQTLVECNCLHPKTPPVEYAEADVKGFAKVLEQHGFAASDGHLLINAEATQTRICSVVHTTLNHGSGGHPKH